MEARGPFCQIIDGAPYGTYINPHNLRQALQFKPQEGDVILVTFPRSGTHWVQQIIQLILYKGDSAKDLPQFIERAPALELQGVEAVEGLCAPRLMRTHLRMGQIPFSHKAKYVYVARNPWDCFVSLYHMRKELPDFPVNHTMDDFLDLFVRGETGTGDHLNHVLSGYTRRMEPNVFFMTYEELKRDTPGTIKRLAHFLGPQHGKAVEESEHLLRRILEKSSVEHMKDVMHAKYRVVNHVYKSYTKIKPETLKKSENVEVFFVREGQLGRWKGILTSDQLRKIESRILESPETFDVINLWKEEWLHAKKKLNEGTEKNAK